MYTRVEVTRHLKKLYVPFLFALRVLSGNIVHIAVSLIDMVLARNIEVRDEVPVCVNNRLDKQVVDSVSVPSRVIHRYPIPLGGDVRRGRLSL